MSEGEPEEFNDDLNDKSYSPQSSDKDSDSGDDKKGQTNTRPSTSSSHPRRSKLWDHFVKSGDSVVCRHCLITLAYRGDSLSNLRQHLRRKHPITEALMSSDSAKDNADVEEIKAETLHLEDVANENKVIIIENGDNQKGRRSGRSVWWKYFRPVTEETSVCLTCHKVLRHATSISNLGKHIQRKHLRNNESVVCHSDSEVGFEIENDDVDHLRHSDEDSVQDSLEVSNSTNDVAEQDKNRKRASSLSHEVILGENILDEDLLNKDSIIFSSSKTKKAKLESDDEWEASLNRFGLYVASLMKMLPRETAARFQVQIINRLLKERFTT